MPIWVRQTPPGVPHPAPWVRLAGYDIRIAPLRDDLAMERGGRIIIDPSVANDIPILIHEMTHARQAARYGPLWDTIAGFVRLLELIKARGNWYKAYRNDPFEREAFAMEDRARRRWQAEQQARITALRMMQAAAKKKGGKVLP